MKQLSTATVFNIMTALCNQRRQIKKEAAYWDEEAKNSAGSSQQAGIEKNREIYRSALDRNALAVREIDEFAPWASVRQSYPEVSDVFAGTQPAAPKQGDAQ